MTRVLEAYKFFLSPFLRVIFGSNFGGCRFYPSCSDYASDAVTEFGVIRGSWLSLKRILKCNPFSKGGLDTVTTNYGHTNCLETTTTNCGHANKFLIRIHSFAMCIYYSRHSHEFVDSHYIYDCLV